LKADCLNITEGEIDDALKRLRESYDMDAVSLEKPSVSHVKMRADELTMEFIRNCSFEFDNCTKVP